MAASTEHFDHILLAVCSSIPRHQASTPHPMLRTSSSGQSSLTRKEGDKLHAIKLNALHRSCSTHEILRSCNSGQRPVARWAAPSAPSSLSLHGRMCSYKEGIPALPSCSEACWYWYRLYSLCAMQSSIASTPHPMLRTSSSGQSSLT
jgi:hypothetical protein